MTWIVVGCFVLFVGFLWRRHEMQQHLWVHVKTPLLRTQSPHIKNITVDIRYGFQELPQPPPLDLASAKVDEEETKKTV